MTALHESSQSRLRYFIERVEVLQDEQRELGADIKDLLTTAKGEGFDPKIIRKVLALRRKPKAEREEEDAILATYLHALGMEGTPLGDWAAKEDA